MRSKVYVRVERPYVRLPVCPSVCPTIERSIVTAACGRFAAEHPVGRRYRSIAAGALRAPCRPSRRAVQQTPALSNATAPAAWRSTANAGGVTLTADGGG